MSLTTFKWNNGSPTSPIVLTDDDIEVLINAASKVTNYSVKGYITTSTGKMYKFIKAKLNELFPELNIIKSNGDPIEELPDEFTISVDIPTINEGKSQIIDITGSSITHDYLNYDIEVLTETDQIVTSGNISAANIIGTLDENNHVTTPGRITVDHGVIKVAAPQENASWQVDLKITAYPKYYEGTALADIPSISKSYILVRCQAIAITSIALDLPSELPIKTPIPIKDAVIPTPSNSTKLTGAIYTYSTTTSNYVSVIGNEPVTLGEVTTTSSQASITVAMRLSGVSNPIASATGTFSIYNLRPTCFIIDQRGLKNMLDSRVMVGNNFYVDGDGNKQNLSSYAALDSATRNTIKWIRDNSHLYVGQWDGNNMRLRQLKDDDKTKFVDGTSAEQYITGQADTAAFTYDVFLKFKSDIYIKTEPDIPTGDEVVNTNYVRVTISKDKPEEYVNASNSGGWVKYDQYHMPGVFEMYLKNNQARSISGVLPTNNISQSYSVARARIRGQINYGMRLVNYNIHRLMAFLFYGYYGTLNAQDVCGFGTNTRDGTYYRKKTGLCNSLGMTDTTNDTGNTTSGNGTVNSNTEDGKSQIQAGYGVDIKSVNFWGLENWWGDLAEWMDDLMVMYARNPKAPTDERYTANPTIYVDDYIRQYIAAHPSATGIQVTKDGADFTITLADLDDYNQQHRFIKITDITGTNVIRIIQTPFTDNFDAYPKQMQLGKYNDMTPKSSGGSTTTGYADLCRVYSAGYIARRSDSSATDNGGITYLHLNCDDGNFASAFGSRLLFEGTSETVEIVDNF